MTKNRKIVDWILIAILSFISVLYVYPVMMILFNSFKEERAISTNTAFILPTAETFAGLENYSKAINANGFLYSLGYSLIITITSVAAILIFCSMCAWYITRVKTKFAKALYYLCVFSMVVPFQMVMFTLSQTADMLKLNTPFNLLNIFVPK